MPSYKDQLADKLWGANKSYYDACSDDVDLSHPGISYLVNLANKSANVLEVGCGTGTKLALISSGSKGTGIDISPFAIEVGKSKYKKLNLLVGDSEKLPFPNESFDLVYSAFVLEHLDNYQASILETLRVTAAGGYTAFLCPNYGAPNRISPCGEKNRLVRVLRIFSGFINDCILAVTSQKKLKWRQVTPLSLKDPKKLHVMDMDTVTEPYLHNLISYLRNFNVDVEYNSSLWELDEKDLKFPQSLFFKFGSRGIFPFKYWGPQLFLVVRKLPKFF